MQVEDVIIYTDDLFFINHTIYIKLQIYQNDNQKSQ